MHSPPNTVPWNFSVNIFSIWNTTRNETFESEAIRIELSRGQAKAMWLVTPITIALAESALLRQDNSYQAIIQENQLTIEPIYARLLAEFDWHNRAGEYHAPYPNSTIDNLMWYQPVDTVPALSAAMLWSRIMSLNGAEIPIRGRIGLFDEGRNPTAYEVPEDLIEIRKTFPVLKRHVFLVLILLVYPVLSIFCAGIKLLLYSTSIGNGFNAVAMLAASRDIDLDILAGAGLSGKLERPIYVAFSIQEQHDTTIDLSRITIRLDPPSGHGDKLKYQFVYS
jgi:hypothetical protein